VRAALPAPALHVRRAFGCYAALVLAPLDCFALAALFTDCFLLSCAAAAADAAFLAVSAFGARLRSGEGWLFALLACEPRFRCEIAFDAAAVEFARAFRFVRAAVRAFAALSRRFVALVSRAAETSCACLRAFARFDSGGDWVVCEAPDGRFVSGRCVAGPLARLAEAPLTA